MKKVVVVVALVACIAAGGFGQQIGITASIAPHPYIGGSEMFLYMNPNEWWIGLDVHILPFLAIKPGVLFFHQGNDQDDESSMLIGVNLDLQYYLDLGNNFSLYVGPGFKFFKYIETDSVGNEDSNDTTIAVSLVVGAQYMLSKNFGFFGDVGASYYILSSEDSAATSSAIVTRNAYLGVVFYFN